MLKKSWITSVGLVIALVVMILVTSRAMGSDPIKVGIVDDFSGSGSAIGQEALIGWKIVIDDFNSRGGLNGRKIELVTRDDKFDPEKAVKAAEELVSEDRVDFLAGSSSSDCALAVSEVARNSKKLFLIHIAKTHRATGEKGHDYVFRSCYDALIDGRAAGKYAAHKKYEKWFVVAEDYEFGRSLADIFWKALKESNPKAEKIGELRPKLQEADYRPIIRQIMDSKPSAIFVAFGGSGGRLGFLQQAKELGLFEEIRVFMNFLADPALPNLVKDAMPTTNAFGSAAYLPYYPASPENAEFVSQYRALNKTGEVPGYAAFSGFCAAKFITESLLKAQSAENDKVVKALEGLTINTPVGSITMRACDHQALAPVIWGRLGKGADSKTPVIEFPQVVTGETVAPTCEEVLATRR